MYKQYNQVLFLITYLLLPGGLDPGQALPSFLLHPLSPLLVRRPTRIGASGPRLQGGNGSAQPAAVQPLHQPQEDPLPWVPRQHSVDQPTSRPHDLARHLNQRSAECREFHPQQRSSLRFMFRRVSWRNRRQQGAPGLQAPSQTGHHHVRPVAYQCVYGRRQRVHPALELSDQVLLVAPVIGREHDIFGRSVAVVGDIEEIAILLEQPQLPLSIPSRLRTTTTR